MVRRRRALADLRRIRSTRRTAAVDRFDVFYRAYIASLIGGLGAIWAVHISNDAKLSAAATADVVRLGPAYCGLLLAVAITIGLRSGSRGGPVAVEAADVRHVLLAPIPVGVALRGPALRQLRFLVFAAAVVGATGGLFLAQRTGGNVVGWIASAAAFAVLSVAFAVAAGWLASGRRLKPALATAMGGVLIAWSVADLRDLVPSPLTVVGRLVVWPAHFDPLPLVAVPVVVVLLAIGLRQLEGVSLEALQRRSALIGQLRFAATMRDLRTVMVLRRQLVLEQVRRRPWLRLPTLPVPVVARGVRSALRTPASRATRMLLLVFAAAACGWGVWAGTTPLMVVGGMAGFLVSLDAGEALAEELDHPTILDLAALSRDQVLMLHLVEPLVQVALFAALAVGALALAGATSTGLSVAAATALSTVVCATAGSTISTVKGAPDLLSESSNALAVPPEAAGSMLLFRTALPPAVAIAGFLPVVFAHRVLSTGGDPVATAWKVSLILTVLVGSGTFTWLRMRTALQESMNAATSGQRPGSRT